MYFYNTSKPPVTWQTGFGDNRERVICAFVSNGAGTNMKIHYDPLAKKVTDRYGYELKFIPHPGEQIIEARSSGSF